MLPPALPADEAERLASLRRMLLLDTPDEEAFDRITRIAQHLFRVPIALVSLIDANRQWFKSCIGLPVRETGRDISFCGHAILGDQPLVIPDTLADPRFADNPLVEGEPNIRFYAGVPLRNADGHNIGTLCIIDRIPRQLPAGELQMLIDLGVWAETALRLRQLSRGQQLLVQQLESSLQGKRIDPVLRVWDRDTMLQILQHELTDTTRQQPLMVAMLALDPYPQLLAHYDEGLADRALREVVVQLRSVLGEQDVIGRYVNSELLLILNGITPEQAGPLAETMQARIAAIEPLQTNDGKRHPLSISIGLVVLDTPVKLSVSDLLSFADQALFQARRHPARHIDISRI